MHGERGPRTYGFPLQTARVGGQTGGELSGDRRTPTKKADTSGF